MKDKTYSLPLLPISMAALTVEGANAIEENLRYLISLFSLFDAQIKTDAIGTLGYLELSESGIAGDGFLIENAVQIDAIAILVEGADLASLSWSGSGWSAEMASKSEIRLIYESTEYLDASSIQEALNALLFNSTADLDATLTLIASCKTVMSFDTLGPVLLRFRSGATWALIENKELTWSSIETDEMDWTGLQNLHK